MATRWPSGPWSILLTWGFQSSGSRHRPLPTALLALPFGIAATAAFALLTDRVVYRFYRRQKASSTIVVIVSLGVMFVMNGIVRLVIGVDDQNFTDGGRFLIIGRSSRRRPALPRVWRSRPRRP